MNITLVLFLDTCAKERQGCGKGMKCCDGLTCKNRKPGSDLYSCQKDATGNVQNQLINKSPFRNLTFLRWKFLLLYI